MANIYGSVTPALPFPDVASLAAFDVSGEINGAYVRVDGAGTYQYDKDSRSPVDGSAVIKANDDLGRWILRIDNPVILLNDSNEIDASQIVNVGTIFLDDGTAAAPSLSFGSDANTGVFLSGPDSLGFSAGGVEHLTIGTIAILFNLPIEGSAGSASDPTFSFGNDTDSGMYRSSSNKVAFSAGGVLSFTIGSSDVVSEVPIHSINGTSSAPSFSFDGNSDLGMYRFGANVIRFSSGSTDILEISNDSISVIGTNRLISNGRLIVTRGTDVSSSSNTTLNDDGNLFLITGTTNINKIRDNDWEEGSIAYLHFADILTITSGQSSTGPNKGIDLTTATYVTSANDTLTIQLFDNRWIELSRSVII